MKIAVIGNSGGGKTTLSRRLGEVYKIPVTHVDSIQFVPGMKIRPMDETRKLLNEIVDQEKWLIDGYGPLDLIEKRFQAADKIIFIDFPLPRHCWWSIKRQLKSFLGIKRTELPSGCYENSIPHTIKLFKTIWRVHHQMRPELVRILNRDNLKGRVVFIKTLAEWQALYKAQHFLQNTPK